MKSYALTVLGTLLTFWAMAQDVKNQNQTVFFEIGGHGLLYSANYQRTIAGNWSARGGIGFLHIDEGKTGKELNFWSLPWDVRYGWLSKNQRHGLELGLGLQILLGSGDISSYQRRTDLFVNPGLIAAYKYHTKNNLFFSLAFTPFYGTQSLTEKSGYFELYDPLVIDGTTVHMWMGLGIGYRF